MPSPAARPLPDSPAHTAPEPDLSWLAQWRNGRSDAELVRNETRRAPRACTAGRAAWLRESERSARLLAELRDGLHELRERTDALRERRCDYMQSHTWVGTRLGIVPTGDD